jgi:hypothetical protein
MRLFLWVQLPLPLGFSQTPSPLAYVFGESCLTLHFESIPLEVLREITTNVEKLDARFAKSTSSMNKTIFDLVRSEKVASPYVHFFHWLSKALVRIQDNNFANSFH